MRRPRLDDALCFLLAVLIIAGWVGYNAVAYDDWTCAFTRCVKVAKVKP